MVDFLKGVFEMTRKVAILLVLTLAAAFLAFAFSAWAATNVPKQDAKQITAPAAPKFGMNRANLPGMLQTEVGEPGDGSAPFRFGPSAISQAASPFVLLHTGAREADNNSTWHRHVVNVAGANIHVVYGMFDNIGPALGGRNNNYGYNCYNPTTGVVTFDPDGTEPTAAASVGSQAQNGAIEVRPNGRAAWIGRGVIVLGANTGSVATFDGGACLGIMSSDTVLAGAINNSRCKPVGGIGRQIPLSINSER
jgi:hypothetical protein